MPASAKKASTPKPQTKDQVSAGGVVYRQKRQAIEVVLISVGEQARWQLPKGLIKKTETPEEAALREVQEETGCKTTLDALIEKIEYWYFASGKGGRVRFHKIVHFYLLKYESGDTGDHDYEVNEARWFKIDEAQTLLTFENEKGVMAKAKEMIQERH